MEHLLPWSNLAPLYIINFLSLHSFYSCTKEHSIQNNSFIDLSDSGKFVEQQDKLCLLSKWCNFYLCICWRKHRWSFNSCCFLIWLGWIGTCWVGWCWGRNLFPIACFGWSWIHWSFGYVGWFIGLEGFRCRHCIHFLKYFVLK